MNWLNLFESFLPISYIVGYLIKKIDIFLSLGKQILYDLARKCDVVIENFLPGKLDKLEVGYNKLSQINPKIIYCAITGFGPNGPYAKKPGYVTIINLNNYTM